MKIENLKYCTGCYSCYSSCPKNAIIMTENEEGFFYPEINKSSCVECGLCEKKCPVLNYCIKDESQNVEAYAMINKDENIRLESSSGGIFSAIAEYILKDCGVVFGAYFDNNFELKHGFVDSKDKLQKLMGSKYIQSQIGDSFKECKKFLEEGKKVLFTGVSCQIIGLKSFLNKQYDNLFCLDVICHGCPSKKLLEKYCNYREDNSGNKVSKISFRNKNNGWNNYNVCITFSNGELLSCSHNKDPFMKLFLSDKGLRYSCYNCFGKGSNRESDITLGDFWGIQEELPEMDDDKGTSLVIVNSSKGQKLISSLKNLETQSVEIAKGIIHNPSYIKNAILSKERNSFYKDIDNMDFELFERKYVKLSYTKRLINKIKRLIAG